MRRKLVFFAVVLFAVVMLIPVLAQAVPNVMSYQGKLNDKNGVPVSGSVTMTFTIYDALTGGNALWTETWTGANSVNVSNGIFNVQLGTITSLSPGLFSNDNLYLGIKVGTDAEMTPRQKLASGPYALKTATEDKLWAEMTNILLNISEINSKLTTPITLNTSRGTVLYYYDAPAKLAGNYNTDSLFSNSNYVWYSDAFDLVYNGAVYDTYSDGAPDASKWSFSTNNGFNYYSTTEVTNTYISSQGYNLQGFGCSIDIFPKNIDLYPNTSETETEFVVRIARSGGLNSYSLAAALISAGGGQVTLYSNSMSNVNVVLQVRVSRDTAYVISSDNPGVINKVSLAGLNPGIWYPSFGSSTGRSYSGGNTYPFYLYVYPLVFASNSSVTPAEVSVPAMTIPLSTAGVFSDVSSNVYERSISYDGGSHFTLINPNTRFDVSVPGTSAVWKYKLGGNNLSGLSKVSKTVLYAY